MISFQHTKAWLLCICLGLLWSCSGSKPSDPQPETDGKDRKVLLTHWADNIILPSYDNFKAKLDVMSTKSAAFTAQPTATTLAEFRQAWVEAYTEWQKVELFDVGPGEKYTIRLFYNIYPADVHGITQNIADPSANLETPDTYARQGFPALDYLINGLGSTDDAILGYYTTAPDAAQRLSYLNRLTGRMNSLLTKVLSEWKGGYRDTFINKTGLDLNSSTGLLVNGYVLHQERYVRSGKFGIPSGIMSNGTPLPEKVEAYYKKDISLTLAKTAQQAVIDFFNGKDVKTGMEGPSFKTYLDALGAKDSKTGQSLSETINVQFSVINQQLNKLSPNLYEQVNTNNQAMKDTYTEMQKVVRLLKVDMTSAMSITITYTDNDGD